MYTKGAVHCKELKQYNELALVFPLPIKILRSYSMKYLIAKI